MDYIQADLELAILHLKQLEQRVDEQRARIARLKEMGAPSAVAEDFLRTLLDSLQLVKAHVAKITGPGYEKSSAPDEHLAAAIRGRT
jgi:hypothetical protein